MTAVWDLFDKWKTVERVLEGEMGDPTGHTPELDAEIEAMRQRLVAEYGDRPESSE